METETIYNEKGGYRFETKNLPEIGAKFKNDDDKIFIYDGLGPAGMLLMTDEDGIQSAHMPPHLEYEGFALISDQ